MNIFIFMSSKYYIIEKLPRTYCREFQGLSTEYKNYGTNYVHYELFRIYERS